VKDTTDIRALEAFRRQYGVWGCQCVLRSACRDPHRGVVKKAEVEAQRRKVEEEAKRNVEEAERQRLASRRKRSAHGEQANVSATNNNFEDTHRLFGTWHCSILEAQAAAGNKPGG
jgi:hypothetical protein